MSILKSTNIGRCNFEVDLGLSVNWCAYNIGATKPEEYGRYFAWGDVKGYEKNKMSEGMFTEKWYNTLTASKINTDLDLQHDAAYEYLKSKWRMPTLEEFHELKENTNKTVEVLNGVSGMRFTAKNGNSIFFPFSGGAYNWFVKRTCNIFICWSSILEDEDSAYYFDGHSDGHVYECSGSRALGFSVRAVCDK